MSKISRNFIKNSADLLRILRFQIWLESDCYLVDLFGAGVFWKNCSVAHHIPFLIWCI